MKSFIEVIKEAVQPPKDPSMHSATTQVGGDSAQTKTKEVEPNNIAPSKKGSKGREILNNLAKGKTITGDTPNAIELNPKYIIRADGIKEEKTPGKTVVFSFGRMNPPTIGHEKLVKAIEREAKSVGGTPRLYLSRTEGDAKNPLPYAKKNKFAKLAFPIVKDTPTNMMPAGFIGLLKHLEDQFDDAVIVVGSDRLANIKKLAERYNGTEYKYNTIKVVSAGERDPDEEGAAGMSASKMRQAVKDGNMAAFKAGLPSRLKGVAKTIFDELSKSLQEEFELDEAVLNTSQRLKLRARMRRFKGKIRMGQRRALRRKANTKVISRRSKRIAIRMMRKRILRGRNYSDISLSARQAVDRIVSRRKMVISRIAKRIEPKLRRAEASRRSGQGYKSISLGPVKKKKLKECMSRDNLIQVVTEMFSQIAEEVRIPLTGTEMATLRRKCNESNNSFETLRTVFDRGVASWYTGLREDSTPQQWGFARVNSFIANGKTRFTADRDLLEADDSERKNEKLATISHKETTPKQLAGFLRNSDEEISRAAREELEKRRNNGDKEAGSTLDNQEEQNPPEQEQEASPIVSKDPKLTAKLADKLAELLKKDVKESADKAVGNVPVIGAKPIHHKASGHKYHMHHMIDPDIALKHQVKHATQRFDRDVDSDIDQFDKPNAKFPDEVPVPTKGSTAKFFAKYKKEREHIHAGEPIDEKTITPKYTGDENSWYLDASGQKVQVYSQSDLKHPEDVGEFLKNPTREKDIGPMMSMKDFLKTQPEKKK